MFCTFYSMVAGAPALTWLAPALTWPSRLPGCLPGCLWGHRQIWPHGSVAHLAVPASSCGGGGLGLPLLEPCSDLLLLHAAGSPGLPALCAGSGLLFRPHGLFLWTQPRGPVGESAPEHQGEHRAHPHSAGGLQKMWGPCSVLGYVAAKWVTCLPRPWRTWPPASALSLAYFQLCCQPRPLLLLLASLPGQAQGPFAGCWQPGIPGLWEELAW